MAIEQPKYKVIKKDGPVELRRYEPYIIAQVKTDSGRFNDAANEGFRILAGYIFGGNKSRSKISMAAPVGVSRSEKIAMAAPVTIAGEGEYTVSFVMPRKYTLDTLPLPDDKRIRFKKVPASTFAVIRFSGRFKGKRFEEKKKELAAWAKSKKMRTDGEYTAAGYDPPWIPWFLKRNEVMVRVKAAK